VNDVPRHRRHYIATARSMVTSKSLRFLLTAGVHWSTTCLGRQLQEIDNESRL
jgi:hypothetical protein